MAELSSVFLRCPIARSASGGPALTIALPAPSEGLVRILLRPDGAGGRAETSDRAIVIALPTGRSEEAILICTNFQIFVDGSL